MYRPETSLGMSLSGLPSVSITSGSLGMCDKHLHLCMAWCWPLSSPCLCLYSSGFLSKLGHPVASKSQHTNLVSTATHHRYLLSPNPARAGPRQPPLPKA